jgi:hypothetical protein
MESTVNNQHNSTTNISTMVSHLPPLWLEFNESPQSNAWAAIQRDWPGALMLGFVYVNK